MLTEFFMFCAVAGGAFVLAQVLLSLFALGAGHGLHIHHHAHGGGHAAPRGGGMHHRGGARASPRAGPRAGPRAVPRNGTRSAPAKAAQETLAAGHHHWAGAWLLGLFNLQGLTAGAAVLGLTGLSASAAHIAPAVTLAIAIIAALLMMIAVAALLSLMNSMDDDGTVHLEDAVGQLATVYLPIPPANQGLGKISLTLQQQVMEFSAATSQEAPLPAGQKVIVVSLRPASVMEVVSAQKFLHDIQSDPN